MTEREVTIRLSVETGLNSEIFVTRDLLDLLDAARAELAAERDERMALETERDDALNALTDIHDEAHRLSTGPIVQDGYWELRKMASDALGVKPAAPARAEGEGA